MSDEEIIILESIDRLKRINPWNINIVKELKKVLKLLYNKINFFIAGIAAENSSYIFKNKVFTILSSPRIIREHKTYITKPLPALPKLTVAVTPGRPLIDLSEIVERINELLEKRVSSTISDKIIVTVPITYDDTTKINEIYKEISNILISFLSQYKEGISIIDVFDTLSKYRFSIVFIVLLMMYMNNEIDFEIYEDENGDVLDVRIQLSGYIRST